MLKRKGEGLPVTMIVVAILVLVTVLIVIIGFKNFFGKGLTDLNSNREKAKDCDKDGVMDFFDQCPKMRGLEEYNGCPAKDTKPTSAGTDCV